MKKALCALGAALVLAGCASEATKADVEAHAACRNTDPPVGSHLVKRSDCGAPANAQNPDGARRDAQVLQQQQTIRQTAPAGRN